MQGISATADPLVKQVQLTSLSMELHLAAKREYGRTSFKHWSFL